MCINSKIMERITKLGLILMMGVSISGCSETMSWQEEVLLHDGSKIIVERSQSYGGSHEIGQSSPVKEHTIKLSLPNTGKIISWTSEYGEDLGRTNFNLLALHILNGTPYLIVEPNLCVSYNKWGRPNPPYVFFQYDGNTWQRITLLELPAEFKFINLIINNRREEDIKKLEHKSGYVSAEDIRKINSSLMQPEYQSILRDTLPQKRINQMCGDRVLYKGAWVMPNDPIARRFIDMQQK